MLKKFIIILKDRKDVFIKNFDFRYRLKMSWFKKLFSSQPSSSQTPTVKYIKVTDRKDEERKDSKKEEKEEEQITNETEQSMPEIDQTQESSCYSWSGATPIFDSQSEKHKWEDDDDEPWWESFKSEPSTQKNGRKLVEFI